MRDESILPGEPKLFITKDGRCYDLNQVLSGPGLPIEAFVDIKKLNEMII